MHSESKPIMSYKPLQFSDFVINMPNIALVLYIFSTIVFNEGDIPNIVSKVFLVVVFLLQAIRNKVTISPFFIISTLFIVYSAFSITWSFFPDASIARVITFANQFACYFAAICLIRWGENRLSLCLSCFVASTFVSAVNVIVVQGITFQDERYSGDAISSGQLALTSALAITICIHRFIQTKRMMHLIAAVCLSACLILTSGRRGFLIATIFIVLTMITNAKGFAKKYFAFFAAVITVMLLLLIVMTNEFLYSYIGVRLESFANHIFFGQAGDSSTQGRARLILFGMQLFFASPSIGNGIGSFENAFMTQHASWSTSADNNYVEILADLGVIGLLLYYIPFIFLLIKNIVNWREKNSLEKYAILCLISMCAVDFATVWFFSKVGMLYIALLCEILHDSKTKKYLADSRDISK